MQVCRKLRPLLMPSHPKAADARCRTAIVNLAGLCVSSLHCEAAGLVQLLTAYAHPAFAERDFLEQVRRATTGLGVGR